MESFYVFVLTLTQYKRNNGYRTGTTIHKNRYMVSGMMNTSDTYYDHTLARVMDGIRCIAYTLHN